METQLRSWGRSLGVVIPKEAVIKESLSEGDKVELIFIKKSNSIKRTFGILKFKRSTEEILNEVNKEGWND